MNNLDTRSFLQDNTDRENKALPEPVFVKRQMLYQRGKTFSAASDYSNAPNAKTHREWRKALIDWYFEIQPHLDRTDLDEETIQDVNSISQWVYNPGPTRNVEKLVEYMQKLNQVMMDMGILDIGVRKDTEQPYGYEFLNGMDFNMNTSDANYKRLKENIRNLADMLKQDTDFMGLITGGNRVGKTTLSLDLNTEGNRYNGFDMTQDHMVITEDDFWDATENNPQYSFTHIDEMSLLFYSKDAMTKKQKSRKKMLRTYAKRNLGLIGCDTSYFNIDREIREQKIQFVIHIPKRGKGKFYAKNKLPEFEYDSKNETTIRPEPTFTFRFPKISGPVWQAYKDVEDKKMDVREKEEEDEVDVQDIAKKVIEQEDRFTKEWVQGNKLIINKTKIATLFDISDRNAAKVKEIAEDNLGLPRPLD